MRAVRNSLLSLRFAVQKADVSKVVQQLLSLEGYDTNLQLQQFLANTAQSMNGSSPIGSWDTGAHGSHDQQQAYQPNSMDPNVALQHQSSNSATSPAMSRTTSNRRAQSSQKNTTPCGKCQEKKKKCVPILPEQLGGIRLCFGCVRSGLRECPGHMSTQTLNPGSSSNQQPREYVFVQVQPGAQMRH